MGADRQGGGTARRSRAVRPPRSARLSVFRPDANSDPILTSRRDFLTGLEGAEGATLDPLTGDFLFSTYGGGDRLVLVSGFTEPPPPPPPPPIPEPEIYALMLAGLAAIGFGARRRRRG